MRILFIGINYWPEKTGIAVFNTRRCEYLARRGHDVAIVTSMPYYPEWRIFEGYRRRLWSRESVTGVSVRRTWLYVPRRVTAIRRVLHEASFLVGALLRSLAAQRPDVLFIVSPPLGLALVARLLSWCWKVPYVFHVEDLQPDAAADLGMLANPRLLAPLYRLELAAYRGAAIISTLTTAMAERIRSKGVSGEKIRVFPHWIDADISAIRGRAAVGDLRLRLGLGQQFLVVHAGNMGVKQGLGVVLEAADRLREDERIRFVFVGDGAERSALQKRADEMNLENVSFVPLLAEDDFKKLLSMTDLALVVQQRTVADIVFPSKVVTLLSAGLPVVASVAKGSTVARVIRESEAGVAVPPENAEALAEAILSLRASGDHRRVMGERGRAYALKKWSPEQALSAMEEGLRFVVSGATEFSEKSKTESAPRGA